MGQGASNFSMFLRKEVKSALDYSCKQHGSSIHACHEGFLLKNPLTWSHLDKKGLGGFTQVLDIFMVRALNPIMYYNQV
jgi:hypothetical protein